MFLVSCQELVKVLGANMYGSIGKKSKKSARPRRKSQAVVVFSAHASSGVTNLQQKTNFGLQCVRLQSRPVFCTRPRRILEKLFASENLSPMLNLV